MAQPEIKQFRYYNDTSENNIPKDFDLETNPWVTNLLGTTYASVIKLGIQTLPGTRFFLNNSSEGITVDHTGVYEIDLRNISTVIHALKFAKESLAIINSIDNASLIVDILYNNTTGTVS